MSRSYVAPLVLAVLHLVLSVIYAIQTPYRQGGILLGQRGAYAADIGAPDERQHANYVARLVRGEGIPVFNPKDPNLYETYQAHQPPLYYGLAAGWSKVVGADPSQAGEGTRVRFFSGILGAITVIGVYFLALWALGQESQTIAVGAAAFAALLPMNVALSGAISNDPLLLCLCTWALAWAARGVREGWCTKSALLCGLFTGGAILTKTTGVALLPILLLAAILRRPKPLEFVAVLVPILVLVSPWWARNQSLYGDPLAIGAFNQAFTGSPQAKVFIESLGATTYWTEWVGWWTARSFVGVFGYMDIWLTNSGTANGANGLYQIVLGVVAVGVIGWLLALSKAEADVRKVHLMNFAFGLIVLLLFVRFNTQYFQAQARYILPAIGPIALAVSVGLHSLLQERPRLAMVLVVLPLVLANAFALSRLPSEFARRVTTAPVGNAP